MTKTKTMTAILAFFLGGIGIHKFYLGQFGLGILYILFCWTYVPAIIALVEAVIFATMSNEDFDKKYNKINDN